MSPINESLQSSNITNMSVIPFRYIGDDDSDGPYLKIVTNDSKEYIVPIKDLSDYWED